MKGANTLTILLYLVSMLLISSCSEQVPRDRPTFSPFQSEVSSSDDGEDDTEEVAEQAIPERPSGAVFIKSDACGCLAGEAITYGSNCPALCQQKGTTVAESTLYFNVDLGPEVELTDLKDFKGWCSTPIINPNTGEAVAGNPACIVEAKDENGNVASLNFNPKSSSATVNIDSLATDMTYRISVVETTSGARSDTIQIRKVSVPITDPVMGPLRLMPVTQYTCMNVDVADSDNGNEAYYDDASRLLFYFVPEVRPEALPEFTDNLYCHDIFKYGKTDPGGERLEEYPGAFTLWSKWDPRFYDLNNNKVMEIEDLIDQNLKNQGYISDSPERYFFKFQWWTEPSFSTSSDGNSSTSNNSGTANNVLGYYMKSFQDPNTRRSFCPRQEHYYGTRPNFIAMRDLVGVDTEAIYLAKKEGANCTGMLIRESELKKYWFYKNGNGVHIEPNNETIEGNKIQFYYPGDEDSPFVKKSHQSLYTIVTGDEFTASNGCTGGSGSSSTEDPNAVSDYPEHDKRLGCIPVTNESD